MRGKQLLRLQCRGRDPIEVTQWADGMIEIEDGDLGSVHLTSAQARKLAEGLLDALGKKTRTREHPEKLAMTSPLYCNCGEPATDVCAQHGPCCQVRADWHKERGCLKLTPIDATEARAGSTLKKDEQR